MKREGWVVKEKGGKVFLTPDGTRRAKRLVRLHRLWELYLVTCLKVDEERVHYSAEEMEHILTPELESRAEHPSEPPKERSPRKTDSSRRALMNPYSGSSFFGFFAVLGQRLMGIFSGNLEPLASDEVQLLVLVLISLSSALVGTFLVLKKKAMLANSLSHTILLGIVGAFFDWEALGE